MGFSRDDAIDYLYSIDNRRRIQGWKDFKVNIYIWSKEKGYHLGGSLFWCFKKGQINIEPKQQTFSYKKVMYIEKGEAMKHYPLPRMPTRIP